MAPLAATIHGVLGSEPGILLAYLFGSQARGDAARTSDVDIALLGPRPFDLLHLGKIQERLAHALGRAVDIVDLHEAPPLLAHEVVREGLAVLVADPGVKLDFELHTIRRWEDTRHMRRQQQELLRERARIGRQS